MFIASHFTFHCYYLILIVINFDEIKEKKREKDREKSERARKSIGTNVKRNKRN